VFYEISVEVGRARSSQATPLDGEESCAFLHSDSQIAQNVSTRPPEHHFTPGKEEVNKASAQLCAMNPTSYRNIDGSPPLCNYPRYISLN